MRNLRYLVLSLALPPPSIALALAQALEGSTPSLLAQIETARRPDVSSVAPTFETALPLAPTPHSGTLSPSNPTPTLNPTHAHEYLSNGHPSDFHHISDVDSRPPTARDRAMIGVGIGLCGIAVFAVVTFVFVTFLAKREMRRRAVGAADIERNGPESIATNGASTAESHSSGRVGHKDQAELAEEREARRAHDHERDDDLDREHGEDTSVADCLGHVQNISPAQSTSGVIETTTLVSPANR